MAERRSDLAARLDQESPPIDWAMPEQVRARGQARRQRARALVLAGGVGLAAVAVAVSVWTAPQATPVPAGPIPSTTHDHTLASWGVGMLAVGPHGMYGADCDSGRVLHFAADGSVSVVAGTGPGGFGNSFTGDGGPALSAGLICPDGLAFDGHGDLFVSDAMNNRVRMIDPTGTITTVVGDGSIGFAGDGGPAVDASLATPTCLAYHDDALYVCDRGNGAVRKVDGNGIITTVAGTGTPGFSGDGGPATAARLHSPEGLAWDAEGNLYISDNHNNRIRRVDTSGTITTYAGVGGKDYGYSGDGGPATQARIADPNGLAFDAAGNLYIAAYDDRAVRMVTPSGVITTVAGTGRLGSSGDGGAATRARLEPSDVYVDPDGNLYIADADHHVIRVVGVDGMISTFASAR
jgi:sugar lactone lactonase YvrE